MLEEILEYIKFNLSTERVRHTIATMNMCEKLAQIYNIDIMQAKLIGAAHDIAKELSKEEIMEYIKRNNIYIDEIEQQNLFLVHGKIASDIVKKNYGFSEDMVEAIAYHTTGKENMSLLGKILFVADAIEEGRTYSNVNEIRNIAYNDLDKAVFEILTMKILKAINNNRALHLDTVRARNYILNLWESCI